MSKAPLGTTCWDWGAANDVGSSECWLCGRRDWDRHPGVEGRRTALAPTDRVLLSATGGCMVWIAISAVGIGLLRLAPGLAVLMLALVGPALVIAAARTSGAPKTGGQVVLLILSVLVSFFVSLVIAGFLACISTPFMMHH